MAKLIFTNDDRTRRYSLVSDNSTDITLVINPNTGNYLYLKDIRDELAKYVTYPYTIKSPKIVQPTNGQTKFNGEIVTTVDEEFTWPANTPKTIRHIAQLSYSLDFTNPIAEAEVVTTSSTYNIPLTKFTNVQFDPNRKYYVRTKVVAYENSTTYKSYASVWSRPVYFYPITSTYGASNASIDIDHANGGLTFNCAKYSIETGNPLPPDTLHVTVKDTALTTDNELNITLPIDGNSTDSIKTASNIIGTLLIPNRPYEFNLKFSNESADVRYGARDLNITQIKDGTNVVNDSKTIRLSKIKFNVKDFDIVTNGHNMPKYPAFGIYGLSTTYDFLRAPMSVRNKNNLLKNDAYDEYYRTLVDGMLSIQLKVYEGSKLVTTMTNNIKLLELSASTFRDMYIQSETTLKLSTDYRLELTITPYNSYSSDKVMLSYAEKCVVSKTFRTPPSYTLTDVDDIDTGKTYKDLTYYGEIRFEKLHSNLTYKGTFNTKSTYEVGDEVKEDGKIYRCVTKYEPGSTFTESFKEITDVLTLPTGECLLKLLGIPHGVTSYVDLNNNLVKGSNIDGLVNSDAGYIKVQNKLNQLLYITKKPLILNIDPMELRKRGLFSTSGRTLRLGKRIYKVRFLETDNTILGSKTYSIEDTKGELDMYKWLLDNLSSYNKEDLGLTSNGKIVGNNATINFAINSNNHMTVSREIIQYNNDVRCNLVIVLEEVLKGYEPYYKQKSLPGDKYVKLDYGSDTGSCGIADSSDILNTIELQILYSLPNYKPTIEDVYYYKVYHHGAFYYIPNKPLGKVKIKDIIDNDLNYGYLRANLINRGDYNLIPTLPNAKSTYILNSVEDTSVDYDTILNTMLRLNTRIDGLLETGGNELNIDSYTILCKDRVVVDDVAKYVLYRNGQIELTDNIEEEVDYFPILVTDAIDYTQDLSYPEGLYKDYTITKEKVTVQRTYLDKEVVTKKREVKKIIDVTKYREETVVTKVPTGKFTVPEVELDSTFQYILLMFYALKSDYAHIEEPLYAKEYLNIKKNNKRNTVFYSENYRSYDEYLARSIMVKNQNGMVPEPYHTNVNFKTMLSASNFLVNVSKKHKILKLSNGNPDKVLLVNQSPGAILAGSITSSELAYTCSSNYNLTNPELDVSTILWDNVSVYSGDDGVVDSWPEVYDKNDNIIPATYLNPYIPYEDLTSDAKTLADNLYVYLVSKNKVPETTPVTDLCFGFVVADLKSLHYIKNGMVTGTDYTPIIKNLNDDQLLLYTTSRSNGKDYLDIYNREEEYKEVVEVKRVPYIEQKEVVDVEEYQEEIWVERIEEVEVYKDVITYK